MHVFLGHRRSRRLPLDFLFVINCTFFNIHCSCFSRFKLFSRFSLQHLFHVVLAFSLQHLFHVVFAFSITFHCSFTMYFLYSRPYITNRTYESHTVTRLKFFKYTRIHDKKFSLHLSFLERGCVHIFPISSICDVVHT